MRPIARALRGALVLATVALFAAPNGVWAQAAEPLSSQRLGRPYVFMFVAYAIVLGIIAVFVISIAVRLARVEKRLRAD
jgi:hypothetical protein